MDKTTTQGGEKSNVIPLRPANPLFPPALRSRLEAGVKSETADPKRLVDNLEDALCAWIVSSVRLFVGKVVGGTGRLVLDKVVGG